MTFFRPKNKDQSPIKKGRKSRAKPPPDKWATNCAEILHSIVVKKLKRRAKWSLSRWANEFTILARELSGDTDRISAILEWYSDHCVSKRAPRLENGRAFRKHFTWLETARDKLYIPKEIKLGQYEELLHSHLKQLGWPNGSSLYLPEVIQSSFKQFIAIKLAVRKLRETYPPIKNYGQFLRHVDQSMCTQYGFVNAWFLKVFDSVKNWGTWNGDLRPYALSVDSERFHEWGIQLNLEFSSTSKHWNRLVKDLHNEGK